ncbi:MAG: kelch repeat-containing protein, partial [Chitinophagaceae bacterium]
MSRINLFVGLLLFLLLPNLAQSQGGTWTWMHGSNGTAPSNGDFGTKGVAAATNEPPARYQACFWTDTAGNFWVFGGVIPSGQGNDLWKYDVATNMWTWMNGPDVISSPNAAGVFGTKGVPSANNYPSARGYGANCWTDNNDDLWLYGGNGGFDDLWKYNIASNQWTWVHGNNIGTTPVYGTLGVAAAANTPGATAEVKSAWVDASNDLWMFGGQTGANVLWKYDIASDQWTWVKGSTTLSAGSYGTLGVESATNEPPGRYSYTRWKDANDNLYLFAGRDLSANKNLNDVWRYRPSTNQWTWVAGTNIGDDSGKYPPSKCKFYDNYVPPSRYENQTTFSNNPCAKAFWTFGGFSSYSVRNDLWLFEIDSFKWSWISGSDSLGPAGNYGTLGVPAATNMPSGKAGQSMWLDKKNNLWVFGGFMGSNSGLKLSNDLWRFEPSPGCVDFSLLSGSALKVPDTLLCLGQSSIMPIGTHNNISVSPLTYVSFNADSSILTFKPPVTTTYRVAIFGGTCKFADSVSFTIHVDSIDIVKLSPPFPLNLCVADSSRMSVNPLWTISVTPSTDVNYQSVGGNQIVFYPSTTTSYVIHASDAARCAISPDSLHVTIQNDGITRHIIPMTDTILCKGDTALYQLVQPVDSWILMPKSYTSFNKDSGTFRLYPLTTTSYRFTAIQKAGCNPHDTIN